MIENKKFDLLLKESEYHIDPLGRLVIDNPELLNTIYGAGNADLTGILSNVGCSNSGC